MKAAELPEKEKKTLQIITIIGILFITILFIKQQIILAMIIGGVIVIAQKIYLKRRKK